MHSIIFCVGPHYFSVTYAKKLLPEFPQMTMKLARCGLMGTEFVQNLSMMMRKWQDVKTDTDTDIKTEGTALTLQKFRCKGHKLYDCID